MQGFIFFIWELPVVGSNDHSSRIANFKRHQVVTLGQCHYYISKIIQNFPEARDLILFMSVSLLSALSNPLKWHFHSHTTRNVIKTQHYQIGHWTSKNIFSVIYICCKQRDISCTCVVNKNLSLSNSKIWVSINNDS